MKLYNYAHAPNPRPSLPQKKESNLRWKKLIFWLGKAAPLNSSQRTRQARCRCSSLMTVHTSPSRSQSAGIWWEFPHAANSYQRL
jgi:hypothetical protein